MTEKAREFVFTREHFDFLRKLSNSHTGIVVSDDKFDMFYSRLAKRLRRLGMTHFDQYVDLLKNDPEREFTEFINAITTNLTSFFRENHHFEFVRDKLLPEHKKEFPGKRVLRIWSAGCSTGEEPYSIAMTLMETLPDARSWDIRILATDIDSNVVQTAQTGVYDIERLRGMQKSRLQKWFQRGKGGQNGKARVRAELRNMITFKTLNLMGPWPMKGQFDFVFCRNVLIYFDSETKHNLVDRYAQVIRPNGHLFIGHSESLSRLDNGLKLLGNTVYKKAD